MEAKVLALARLPSTPLLTSSVFLARLPISPCASPFKRKYSPGAVLRRCVSKEEALLEELPKEYYDDEWQAQQREKTKELHRRRQEEEEEEENKVDEYFEIGTRLKDFPQEDVRKARILVSSFIRAAEEVASPPLKPDHFDHLPHMASITAPHASYSLIRRSPALQRARTRISITTTNINGLRVFASQGPINNRQSSPPPPPGVDTRIQWDNEDEGWVGGSSSTGSNPKQQKLDEEEEKNNLLGKKFADLLNDSSDSHYQFLGVSAEADMEDIKSAYRRLTKEYHPDTTSLPLKDASVKFMKLREVYDVLSNEETRMFYDWTLAQEAASRQTEKMRMKLEDPYEQELMNSVPIPDTVDRLGGKNMALGDQAMSALTIDIFIIIFAICTLIYVIYFKEPS